MMTSRLLMCILLFAPLVVFGETNHWDRIQELMKVGTPQGNPQLEGYLKDLPSDQMLQAAREFCQFAQSKYPEADWPQATSVLLIVLAFYGTEKGELVDDRFDGLLKSIIDANEGPFFREALVRILRERYWSHLRDPQRKKCETVFLSLLKNRKTPTRLRSLSCRELELSLAECYRHVIAMDINVKPLRSDKEKWRNLNDLVRKGNVKLGSQTLKLLKSIRNDIDAIVPSLSSVLQDETEPPTVRERAKCALGTFADLPVVP